MKILIDISNSPHVLFFNPIIKELEKRGHEVIITAREHAQTLELLKIYGYKYELIGKHAGKNKFKKLLNALSRVFAIKKFIKQQKPDVCISHQSPYVIYAGFLSGIKRIYIFDNEHARLQNKLTFPAANKIICPEAITEFSGKKFVKYPGIKEAVYLRNLKIKDIGYPEIINSSKKKIFIRTEITTAAYHEGNSLINLVKELSKVKDYQVIVSPRKIEETEEYKKIPGIKVLEKPVDGPSIIKQVNLVMSGGGTMNREAAVLSVPVISLYSGDLLAVDRYLIEKELMVNDPNPALGLIKRIIESKPKKVNFDKLGKEALDIIIREIEEFRN